MSLFDCCHSEHVFLLDVVGVFIVVVSLSISIGWLRFGLLVVDIIIIVVIVIVVVVSSFGYFLLLLSQWLALVLGWYSP
jgi:hypothetical protein